MVLPVTHAKNSLRPPVAVVVIYVHWRIDMTRTPSGMLDEPLEFLIASAKAYDFYFVSLSYDARFLQVIVYTCVSLL